MDKFSTLTAIAAPLLRINVDTDAIIPSREMKRVSKDGLSEGLFAGWRYRTPGSREENPDFILNQEPYRRARILLSGINFGCGSSREHAVWALHEWGIRAIIAPSFGSIFQGNCQDVLDREGGEWTLEEAEEALRLVQRDRKSVV